MLRAGAGWMMEGFNPLFSPIKIVFCSHSVRVPRPPVLLASRPPQAGQLSPLPHPSHLPKGSAEFKLNELCRFLDDLRRARWILGLANVKWSHFTWPSRGPCTLAQPE